MFEAIGLTVEETDTLTIPDLVALLQLTGGEATETQIRANISAGAPANADGTISLRRYGAWLDSLRKRT